MKLRKKPPTGKRAGYSPEQRKLELELLRQAEQMTDPRDAAVRAGFWLAHLAPRPLRETRV